MTTLLTFPIIPPSSNFSSSSSSSSSSLSYPSSQEVTQTMISNLATESNRLSLALETQQVATSGLLQDIGSRAPNQAQQTRMNKQLLLNQTHQGQCLQAVMKQQSRLENLLLAQQSILNIIHRTLRESNIDPNAHPGLSTSLRTQEASQSDRLIVSQEGVDQRFTLKRDIIQKIFCQWIEK